MKQVDVSAWPPSWSGVRMQFSDDIIELIQDPFKEVIGIIGLFLEDCGFEDITCSSNGMMYFGEGNYRIIIYAPGESRNKSQRGDFQCFAWGAWGAAKWFSLCDPEFLEKLRRFLDV